MNSHLLDINDFFNTRTYNLNYTTWNNNKQIQYYYSDQQTIIDNITSWLGYSVFNVSNHQLDTNGSVIPDSFYYAKASTFQILGMVYHNSYISTPSNFTTSIIYFYQKGFGPNYQLGNVNYSSNTIENVTYNFEYPNLMSNTTVVNSNILLILHYSYSISDDVLTINNIQFPCWKVNYTYLGYDDYTTARTVNNSILSYYYNFGYFSNKSGYEYYSFNNQTKMKLTNYVYYNQTDPIIDTYWISKDYNFTIKSISHAFYSNASKSVGNNFFYNGTWLVSVYSDVTNVSINSLLTFNSTNTSNNSNSNYSSGITSSDSNTISNIINSKKTSSNMSSSINNNSTSLEFPFNIIIIAFFSIMIFKKLKIK